MQLDTSKATPPDSPYPHDCVILAIGYSGGWAIVEPYLKPDRNVWSGCGNPVQTFEIAYDAARAVHRPLVIVIERGTLGSRMSAAVRLGHVTPCNKWEEVLKVRKVPKARVARVDTATWRTKVLPGDADMHTFVRVIFPARDRTPMREASDAEAEALCVAQWAVYGGDVGVAVRKAGKRYP